MDMLDQEMQHIRRELLADDVYREVARVAAWFHFGAPDMRIESGRPVGVPDGWPRTVTDPDKYFEQYVDNHLYQRRAES